MGVKSVSVVYDLPYFDPSKGLPPEYLHSLLLGVVRYFTILWFSIRGQWFCGAGKTEVDKMMLEIKVPDFI